MSEKKNKFCYPLWNLGKYGYLPIFSRTCEEKKIYDGNELEQHEIVFCENPIDELKQSASECSALMQECHKKFLDLIAAKKRQSESITHLPIMPKTPNPKKRTVRNRKIIKRQSSSKRSTRLSTKKAASAVRRSLMLEALKEPEKLELNPSDNEVTAPDHSKSHSSGSNQIKVDETSTEVQSVVTTSENVIPDQDDPRNANESNSSTGFVQRLFSPDTDSGNEKQLATELSTSMIEVVSKQPSKKSAPKKRKPARESSRTSKSNTRRTRQAVRSSAERNSTASVKDASTRDSLEMGSRRITRSKNTSSSSITNEKQCARSSEDTEKNSATPHEEIQKKKLSVTLLRLSSENIAKMVGEQQSPVTVAPSLEANSSNQQDRIELVLSDGSEEFEEERPRASSESRKKSNARKRKSEARRKSLAKKRRTLRSAVAPVEEELTSAQEKSAESANTMSEDSPTISPKATRKTRRAKPRIAKPVVKKKDVLSKATGSAVKKRGRTPKIMSASATPVRTRQRFMSPLVRTPTSAKLHTTVKSFLLSNTPEPINKEAILETKRKVLEEKERQEGERQKKLEEEKKHKLAEAKKKREERALQVIHAREKKAQEEKERHDHLQGLWKQRAEGAERTKTQQNLQKTAKITKEFEKIAKAGAKRKEEEEEKLKRMKEQTEERQKRLQQQQEQKLREKHYEEQKKAEEEKAKEKERLAQLERDEKAKREKAAQLKKKYELEEKNRKHQEKMEKMRKKAEMNREALKKQRMEEKRLAKEQEEQRKLEEKRARKEKLRLEREQAEAAREEMLRLKEAEAQRRAKEAEAQRRLLQLEKEREEREAERLEEAKRKEALLKQKMKMEEMERQRLEKEKENLRKVKAAEEKIKALQAKETAKLQLPSTVKTVPKSAVDKTFTLNSTYSKDESVNNYDMTPRGPDKILIPSTATNYNLDDFCSDDSTDDEDRPKKEVPRWAKGALLQAAFLKQYQNPPDLSRIFPNLLNPVNLPSIFKRRKERYIKRTSSAHWNSPIMPPGHISFTQHCKGFD